MEVIRKWIFLARLKDEPLMWAFKLGKTIQNRLRAKYGASLERYVRFIAERRRQPSILRELEAATADAQYMVREIPMNRLPQIARWKMYERGMPLDYVLGWTPFAGLRISVHPPILIPRRDTENWVFQLKRLIGDLDGKRILEVGTGTGCIAIALAKDLPKCHFVAIDVSRRALDLAKLNAACNSVNNIDFRKIDIFTTKMVGFDMIISNPPYIPRSYWAGRIAPSTRRWESRRALIGDFSSGTTFHQRLIKLATLVSTNEQYPRLAMELDGTTIQANHVIAMGRSANLIKHKILFDSSGRPRAILFY
jgi:HemK-like putative methylase